MVPSLNEQAESKDTKTKATDMMQLLAKLTPEQVKELEGYMERIKSEYLQKILEQVYIQN